MTRHKLRWLGTVGIVNALACTAFDVSLLQGLAVCMTVIAALVAVNQMNFTNAG